MNLAQKDVSSNPEDTGYIDTMCYAKGQHWAEPGRKPEGGGAGSGSEAEPLMDDLII